MPIDRITANICLQVPLRSQQLRSSLARSWTTWHDMMMGTELDRHDFKLGMVGRSGGALWQ